MDPDIMFHETNIYCDTHHVRIIGFGQPVFNELSGDPEGLLFGELHKDQEIDDKVHALAVTDIWIAD